VRGYITGKWPKPGAPGWEDFSFDSLPEDAWSCESREEAESECSHLNLKGITIPSAHGGTHMLSDFRVEEVEPGKFAIYCEGPFIQRQRKP
jgi:hypothetical protein